MQNEFIFHYNIFLQEIWRTQIYLLDGKRILFLGLKQAILHFVYNNLKSKMKNVEREGGKHKAAESRQKMRDSHILDQMRNEGSRSIGGKQASNFYSAIIEHTLISLNILHTIVAELLIQDAQSSSQSFSQSQYIKYYRVTYIGIIILKLIIVIPLCFKLIFHNPSIPFLSSITHNIFRASPVLKQIDISFSAFLCFANPQQNIPSFTVSALVYLIYTIYLQNYVIRTQLTYCSSNLHAFAFRILIISNYSVNLILVGTQSQAAFRSYYGCLSIICFAWYMRQGHKIYYSSALRLILLLLATLFTTFYLKYLEGLIIGFSPITSVDIAKLSLIFLLVAFSFNNAPHNFKPNIGGPIKQYDLYLNRLLDNSFKNSHDRSELIGILQFNQSQWNGLDNIYDPFLRSTLNAQDFFIQKQSLLRAYLKKAYQNKMITDGGNCEVYLQYCEYLCNYDLNYYEIEKCIQKIEELPLKLMDRVKLDHMKGIVKQSNFLLNKELYNSKLHLQAILQSENVFILIQKNIFIYIQQNIRIWQMMKLPEISLEQFRASLNQSFLMKQLINYKWNQISSFVFLNNKWTSTYLKYRFLINNQRLKQKQIQTISENFIEKTKIGFDSFSSKKQLLNPLVMFDEESFCFRAGYQSGQLVFEQVNERFEDLTGYTSDRVLESSISILMTEPLKNSHKHKFDSWLQTGYISNQKQYRIKETEIVTVNGNILTAFKYFKCFYTLQSGLNFYALFKVDQQQRATDLTARSLPDSKGQTKKSSNRYYKQTQMQFNHLQNMFIKNQGFECVSNTKQIFLLKLLSRLFLLVMILSTIFTSVSIKDSTTKLIRFSSQYITYMNVYRFPVILNTNYMKHMMNIGNQSKVSQQIQTVTKNFMANSRDTTTKNTLFDQNLNPNKTYYPCYNHSFLSDDSLTQIDLFYTIVSSISTLSNLPINKTSPQYQRFNSYLIPSYDNMINHTKYKLHETFSSIFEHSTNIQIITMAFDLLSFITFISLLIFYVNRILLRTNNVMLIITSFGQIQVNKSQNYWRSLFSYFHQLFSQFQEEASANTVTAPTIKKVGSSNIEQIKIQTNNSSKRLKQEGINNINSFKLRTLIVISTFLLFASPFSIKINNIIQFNRLYVFEQAGFYFLKFFPCGPLVAMGCMEKYYFDANPQEISFKPQKYQDLISANYIFGSSSYTADQSIDSVYYKKRRNYFFGNPCQYNPKALAIAGVNVSKCEQICNGTFKAGLSAFLRYTSRLGDQCINNKINFTSAQVDEFTLGGSVLSAFVIDSINTWLSEFIAKLSSTLTNNQIQAIIIVIVIFLVHLFIIQNKAIGFLKQQEQFTKKVYADMAPQSLLINQKIIKQKFVAEGIISI